MKRLKILANHPEDNKDGPKYKKMLHVPSGLQLDLFIITPPADFAVQFVIRTGPAGVSHALARRARRMYRRLHDGALYRIPKSEERPPHTSMIRDGNESIRVVRVELEH